MNILRAVDNYLIWNVNINVIDMSSVDIQAERNKLLTQLYWHDNVTHKHGHC